MEPPLLNSKWNGDDIEQLRKAFIRYMNQKTYDYSSIYVDNPSEESFGDFVSVVKFWMNECEREHGFIIDQSNPISWYNEIEIIDGNKAALFKLRYG